MYIQNKILINLVIQRKKLTGLLMSSCIVQKLAQWNKFSMPCDKL